MVRYVTDIIVPEADFLYFTDRPVACLGRVIVAAHFIKVRDIGVERDVPGPERKRVLEIGRQAF